MTFVDDYIIDYIFLDFKFIYSTHKAFNEYYYNHVVTGICLGDFWKIARKTPELGLSF